MSTFTQRKHRVDPVNRAHNWLIISAGFISLFFFTNLNDPFNAPKSWILSIAGFWLLPWVALQIKSQIKLPGLKVATYVASAFLAALTLAFLFTDNKYVGLFGEYQRRTGFLTYLCLTVFFLASAYLIRLSNINKLEIMVLIVGFFAGSYGVLQHFGKDPVKWNNPYNSVLSTLGNPDFAAAVMAILAVLTFGFIIRKDLNAKLRSVALLNLFILFAAIYFSKAFQGFIASGIGIGIILIVWLWQKNKRISIIALGLSIIAGTTGILGMLNIGPLGKYLFKASVTYRGDYWRAGLNMFKHHILFGVGLDRYGTNFRAYRDATQAARRGPEIVSNAAHNVIIQLAATGGIVLLITYLGLLCFIAWRGVVGLRENKGANQLLIAIIFAAWIAYQSQSFISIDNVGIAIWGYLLGGTVVGLSIKTPVIKYVENTESLLQPVISLVLAGAMILVSTLFLQAESNFKNMHSMQIPKSGSDIAGYTRYVDAPIRYLFKEPTFILSGAANLAQAGDINGAISRINKVIEKDPKFYDAYQLIASMYEYQKNWPEAISKREQILKLDPYNQKNRSYLEMDKSKL